MTPQMSPPYEALCERNNPSSQQPSRASSAAAGLTQGRRQKRTGVPLKGTRQAPVLACPARGPLGYPAQLTLILSKLTVTTPAALVLRWVVSCTMTCEPSVL